MGRKAHLVGSIPGANATEAMETALSRLGPYLLTLSDGETGWRAWWIGAVIQQLATNPDIELAGGAEGDFSDYDKVPQYRVREGRSVAPENLEAAMPYAQAFAASYPLFQELRVKHGRPDLPFQVGIPAPLDLSADTFGYDVGFDPRYLEPSFAATLSQINKIAAAGADVVFQLETPAALIAVASAAEHAGESAAAATAQQAGAGLAQVAAATPPGTRFGVHLCLGDMNHKAYTEIPDISPAVLVANALTAAWPADRPLEFIHVPFAAAQEPPTFDEAFYEPLSQLDIPGSVRFVAGCIHESLSPDKQVELLRLIESHLGREVDVAAACGLGRRPDVSQAWDAMEKALLLVGGTSA